MAVKTFKPKTPGQRFKSVSSFEQITKETPEKSLVKGLKKSGGRNNFGRVTSWHRGGGHKRKLRIIDFKRNKYDIPATVASIEYDPNRTSFIALLNYADGEKRYILAPGKLSVGDTIVSVEMKEKKGGQLGRSAGSAIQLVAKEDKYALLKLPSGEMRKVPINCYATLGQVSNVDHVNISIGKAGRSRWMGRRPNVRGVAMNPVDHPMGGGEGKTSGGRHPVSPWGQLAKGLKTRKKGKTSDTFIVKRRK
jgi:large subunit ribosomal protein L2